MIRLYRVVRGGEIIARGLSGPEAANLLRKTGGYILVEEPTRQWDPTPDEKEES